MGIDWQVVRESLAAFSTQNPIIISIWLFLHGGWVIFLLFFIKGVYDVWIDGRQGQYFSKWKWTVLAIDIPKNNEQTPKAVENVFMAIAGAQTNANLIEKYWEGKIQESISFEIISQEGFIRYFIRTPVHFRDLVEASIYAQYPDAEITEVEDYAEQYKAIKFPNDEYNLWGTEFLLVKDYPYPIRTYPEFEHQQTQTFLDPMAGLLEIMSRMGPTEQAWIQYVVTPLKPPGWDSKAKKVVGKLMGKEVADSSSSITDLVAKPIEAAVGLGFGAFGHAFGMDLAGAEDSKKEEDQWKMFKMTPGERSVLERVEKKLAKHAFRVKFRMVYFAKRDVFAKTRGVAGLISAIQQFNTTDGNGFMPGKKTKTAADYFQVKRRVGHKQNTILRHFIQRKNWYGESSSNNLLCSEELASLWHFPVMTVKAAQVEMIGSKKTAPPSKLPYKRRGASFMPPADEFTVKEKPQPVALEPSQPILPVIDEPETAMDSSAPVSENGAANDAMEPIAEPVAAYKPMQAPVLPPPSHESAGAARRKSAPPSNLPTV